MNLDNLNNLTPEQVNQIKENGGFSGSAYAGITFGNDAQSFEPQASIPISGYATQVRPRMSTHGTHIITGPSATFLKSLHFRLTRSSSNVRLLPSRPVKILLVLATYAKI